MDLAGGNKSAWKVPLFLGTLNETYSMALVVHLTPLNISQVARSTFLFGRNENPFCGSFPLKAKS